MLKPTVPAAEFEKCGFKRCKKPYNKCFYLCVARGKKMLFVSDSYFSVFEWNQNDPRIHKNVNCKYRDIRDSLDIIYDLIKMGFLKSEYEEK